MLYVIIFSAGLIMGVLLVLFIYWLRRKEAKEIAQELISQTENQKLNDLEAIFGKIKESFKALSFDALSKQTELGGKELEGKKELIDQTLEMMKEELEKVEKLVVNFEKDREYKFGELTNQLKSTAEQTGKLQETTQQLRAALASTKVRGQWGERMAEDVLQLAGFIENINYKKQKSLEKSGTCPDYTFLLPQELKVNMDVKFPLDNYLRYLEAEGEIEKTSYKERFLKDVRNRVKEVTSRDYINPEENTVDYVIVFIPNEQIYAFIHENDGSIIDESLKNKVILCSPLTLYAVLAVIRQAVDNFNLEKTAAEMLSLFGTFNKQWKNFVDSFEKMGKKIEEAQNEFNYLTTTRRTQLERPLAKIENLRIQKGIEEALLEEELTSKGSVEKTGNTLLQE